MSLQNLYKFCKFFFVLSLLFCNPSEENSLRFSKSISPIVFDLQKDILTNHETGDAMPNANSCKSCHKQVYENWFNSRHKVAFTNELYHESHEREPMTWCVNCHAPLVAKGTNIHKPELRIQREDGISCNVCHVRNGKVLTSKIPAISENRKNLFHSYIVNAELSKSEFCANCHEFNFPTILGATDNLNFAYSHLPMQNTFGEFENSFLKRFGHCQDCHLESNTNRTHTFSGGHDANRLSDSIYITAVKIGKNTVLVSVFTNGIAHSFPTGDLFRALKVKIRDAKSKLEIAEIVLKKEYQFTKKNGGVNLDSPSMYLVSDTAIPPSMETHSSQKTFSIQIPNDTNALEMELYMDYLHGINRTLTKIPLEKTMLPFKRVKLELRESTGKG